MAHKFLVCALIGAAQGFQLTSLPQIGVQRATIVVRSRVCAAADGEGPRPSTPPPFPPPEERRRSEPGYGIKDILSALPYAIGLVSLTTLAASQSGLLDNWQPFGDFEIPAEWLQE